MGGNAASKPTADKPVVLIIGGGYGGVAAAKALDGTAKFNVVLIDRKNYFLHNLGNLRASVDIKFSNQILVPYNKLLANGNFVQGYVNEITDKAVHIEGHHAPIEYKYLIIATGSQYPFPGKVTESQMKTALGHFGTMVTKIEQSKEILIVGGGPVGCELAGEIISKYPKDKKVILVHSHDKLLPADLLPDMRDKTAKQLTDMKVEVVLNEKVEIGAHEEKLLEAHDGAFLHGERTVRTASGKEFKADLILFARGAHVNNNAMRQKFHDKLDEKGRIKVNKSFQVEGHEHIFAIGDCCNVGRQMAFYAGMHAKAASDSIKNLEEKKPVVVYAGDGDPMMSVPLGPKNGFTQAKGKVLPAFLTSKLKGGNLMAPMSWKLLNLKAPKPEQEVKFEEDKKENKEIRAKALAAAFKINEPEAVVIIDTQPLGNKVPK